jgi:hypothetical protein
MELKVRGCYFNGQRIDVENGEPIRGSEEAQDNAIDTMIKILQRVEAEKKDEPQPAA